MVQNSQYKLSYFDGRGAAEPIRYIFAYAGVEYEDDRIKYDPSIRPDRQADWLKSKKASTPFHQVPVLEVDGKQIGQTNAICRFLGRRFNLAGKDEFEQAYVDGLADYANDMLVHVRGIFYEDDDNIKKQVKDKFFGESIHDYLKTFEEHLKKNGGGNGFFVGNGPTWADFRLTAWFPLLNTIQAGFLDKYPLLKAHEERVNNLKGIKEWVAKRPQTVF